MSLDLSPRLAEFLSSSESSGLGLPLPYSGQPTICLQPPRRVPQRPRRAPQVEISDRRSEIPGFIDPEVWNAALRPLDADWGDRADTEFLLNLYRTTGGRWVVIHDRWCGRFGSRTRSMEQLKSRFVKVLSRLCASTNFRYIELYDSQRRNFLERAWKRDPLISEQTSRIIKDLFKKKKPISAPPVARLGVALASQLARAPEFSPELAERVRLITDALGLDLAPGFIRSLRIQRALAAVHKLIHSLLILKDVIASKRAPSMAAVAASSQTQGAPAPPALAAGAVRVRVQPGGVSASASQSRSTKKRKTDGSHDN